MSPKKDSQISIITVTGKDTVGIIARLANIMANANINIVDVNQKIMPDNFFVMTMAVDFARSTLDMAQIKKRLDRTAKDMSLNITLQNENLFKAMHRI